MKSIEKTLIQKNKNRICLFLIGFAFLWLVGSFVRGDMGDLLVYSKRWFVDIGYKHLAGFFRRALGLPIRGGFGAAFTLAAGIFYLVCGVSLYNAPSTYESEDWSDNEWHGLLSRGAHFICCYCFLPLVSYVMVNWDFYAVVNKNHGLAAVGFIIFLAYLLVSLIQFFQETDDICRMKWLTRFLSSFAIMLGVSGISAVIWELDLAGIFFLPAHLMGWMEQLAAGQTTALWYVLLLILILAVFVVICICCAYQIGKRIFMIGFSAAGSFTLVFFAMNFYDKQFDAGVNYRALTQWVLIIVMSVIWSVMCKKKGIPVVLLTMGITAVLLALFRTARLFYTPVNRLLKHYSEIVAPLQDAAWDWGLSLIPQQVILMLVVFIVAAIAIFLSFIPLFIQKRSMLIPKGILRLLCLLFHCGVILRFMGQDWFFVGPTSYVLITISLTGLAVSLIIALIGLDYRSLLWVLYAIITTAVVAVPCVLYAYFIGFIVFGIFASCNTISLVAAYCKCGSDIRKDVLRKEMLDKLDIVDSAVESGGITLMQGASLASSILDAYTPFI